MDDQMANLARRIEDAATKIAHYRRIDELRAAIARTERLISEAATWFDGVPRVKARRRGSSHWRAGIYALKAMKDTKAAEDSLNVAEWGSAGCTQSLHIADSRVWLATFHAGQAIAAMEEASVRLKCGNKSLSQRDQSVRIEAEIERAAATVGSGSKVAKSVSDQVGRSELTTYRKILKARRRMTASN